MHLRSKKEYLYQYDDLTINRCRSLEKSLRETNHKEYTLKDGTKISPQETKSLQKSINKLLLYITIGEAYEKKEETINNWIAEDKRKDTILEQANPPKSIQCRRCSSLMDCTNKELLGEKNEIVLFFFECPNKCIPKRAVFSNGEEWKKDPISCPKCSLHLNEKSERKGDRIITKTTCSNCDYSKTDTLDLSPKEEPMDPQYETDKKRFCLTEEAGEEYISQKRRIKDLLEFMDDVKDKEDHKDVLDKIEKLSIPQLKEKIVGALENEVYQNITFETPLMDRIVSIGFSVEDPTNQHEYDSRQKLTKLLKTTLENTNCCLMSDGIYYRLGMLSGRIRIYENEKDILSLIKKK